MTAEIKKGTRFSHRTWKCKSADGQSTDRCVVTCVRNGVAFYRFVNEENSHSYIPLEVFEQYAEDIQ